MNKIVDSKVYKTLLISISLTILLFISSLTLNVYFVKEGENTIGALGIGALLLGFFSMNISWLANPCLLLSLIHLRRENIKKALIFSVMSVLFGMSFMLYDQIIANEGGVKTKIIAYGLGYWLWLTSLIVNFFGIFITDRIMNNQY